ncbi:UNVERIFIED_CONTAM: PEP-CTERM sorting domain-containing protein, partial [Salmonella enterica subsp. enterica serovar Weltevreden]
IFQTDFNGPVQGIPEPGTLALAGLALGGLALARRRKV